MIASKAPGSFRTKMAWASPAIVVIIEHEKIAIRRIRSPEDTRTSLRIQSGATTRMRSDIVSATRLSMREGRRLGEVRRTRYLGNTNSFSEHALGVLVVFPGMASLFTDPEHLSDEKDPLKEEENSNP